MHHIRIITSDSTSIMQNTKINDRNYCGCHPPPHFLLLLLPLVARTWLVAHHVASGENTAGRLLLDLMSMYPVVFSIHVCGVLCTLYFITASQLIIISVTMQYFKLLQDQEPALPSRHWQHVCRRERAPFRLHWHQRRGTEHRAARIEAEHAPIEAERDVDVRLQK